MPATTLPVSPLPLSLASRETLRIDVRGNVISMENDNLGLLELFTTERLVYGGAGQGFARETESLLRHPTVRANAGLLPVIRYCAALSRQDVNIFHHVPRIRQPLTRGPAHPSLPHDDSMLQFVASHERGLIVVDRREVSEALLIAEVAAVDPRARIRVVGASRDKLRRVGHALRKYLPTATILRNGRAPETVDRVVLGTFVDMAEPEFQVEQADFVFVLDARHAQHENAQLMLLPQDSTYRLFGLLSDCQPLSEYERDWMLATFGPHEVEIPRHEWAARTVHTVWSPIKAPFLAPTVEGVDLQRHGYWHNPVRNRRVAGLARAAAAGDRRELLRYLDRLDADYVAALGTRRTVLVAANFAHVLNICRLMPGWPVSFGPGFDVDALPADDRRLLRAGNGTWPTAERGIVTLGALPHTELGNPDILIWAAGGIAGGSALHHRLSVPASSNRPMVAIDFDDKHSVELRRLSRQRRRNYDLAGWYPVGVDQATGRITQFLASRHWSPT